MKEMNKKSRGFEKGKACGSRYPNFQKAPRTMEEKIGMPCEELLDYSRKIGTCLYRCLGTIETFQVWQYFDLLPKSLLCKCKKQLFTHVG